MGPFPSSGFNRNILQERKVDNNGRCSRVVTNVSEEPGFSIFRLKELSTASDLLLALSI
jgi:hypothetical protein